MRRSSPWAWALSRSWATLASKVPHRCRGRARALEALEEVGDALLDLAIGIEHHLARRVVDQANRQRHPERASTRLIQDTASEPRPQHVQLGVGHGALEPEQEPVVEVARIIDTVLVEDQRVGQRADLQQPVPVAGVSGQARDLEAEHDADAAHADLAHQRLEALAVGARGGRLALVRVDHLDPFEGPAQRHGPLAQSILAPGALGILEDLPHRGLTDVQVGVAPQVACGHLLMDGVGHECPSWMCSSVMAARRRITSSLVSSGQDLWLTACVGPVGGAGKLDQAAIQAPTPFCRSTTSPSRGTAAPCCTARARSAS